MKEKLLKKEKGYWFKVLFDGILLLLSFMLLYYLKRGDFRIEVRFQNFLIPLFIWWFLTTLLSKKYMILPRDDYFSRLRPCIVAFIVLTSLVSLTVYVMGWYFLSRLIIYGTLAVYLILELGMLSFRILLSRKRAGAVRIPFQIIFFLLEFVVVLATFISLYFYKRQTLKLRDDYLVLLMGIFFAWLLVSFLVHRFRIPERVGYIRTLAFFWRSEIILIGLTATLIFGLNLAQFSRSIILGSLLIFSVTENVIVTLFYLYRQSRKSDEVDFNLFEVSPIDYDRVEEAPLVIGDGKYSLPKSKVASPLFRQKLKKVYLGKLLEVYDFINNNIFLERVNILKSVILSTRSPYNFEILEDQSLQLILNIRELNDFRRINKNLSLIHQKLIQGGIYIGQFRSLKQQRSHYVNRYNYVWANMLLFYHFIFKRVAPKLPLIKKIYFGFTKGRKRIISEAEALGRLYFSGFEIVSLKEIDLSTWFIVRKKGEPLRNENPSYGILFKQRRVGKDGKAINMYKMRTMYPFSEHIHKLLFGQLKLDDRGKIKGDFRITGWGRFLRKFWIDEIPMIFNWLKGDVKLVGVRPLSESFFNTYPERFRRERIKYKPGLIPPFYVDMPHGMEEVIKSEERYLKSYAEHPFRTDIVYFFKALNNILFRHAKSS